ncbi:MAG: hypothetical protein COA80_14075 [Leeuwenhoekiella sp.]|nr:MAG: hypothetical protein COA80_14075 [Leeuwenhoekiella sp.]
MKLLQSINFFFISLLLNIVFFGLSFNLIPDLGFSQFWLIQIAFIISFAGITLAIAENRFADKKKSLGYYGNLITIILIIVLFTLMFFVSAKL